MLSFAGAYSFEDEGVAGMNLVVSRVKQIGLYHLVSLHPGSYDEQIVEEFFVDAEFQYSSNKKHSDVTAIISIVQDKEITINLELLERLYGLPYDGLSLEELESFGSKELLKSYWDLFTSTPNLLKFICIITRRTSPCIISICIISAAG